MIVPIRLNPASRILNPIGMTQTLHVTGMTCGGCENAVKRAVGKLPGVASVEASHAAGQVTVDFDEGQTSLDSIKSKISTLGYQVQ
jgi:copper chaperone CopZ